MMHLPDFNVVDDLGDACQSGHGLLGKLLMEKTVELPPQPQPSQLEAAIDAAK
jgi:hypothetical protein